MKILITGSSGFIGRNLTAELKSRNVHELFLYDVDTPEELLEHYTEQCDFVFHLAGINRPKDEAEFLEGNRDFTAVLLRKLKEHDNKAPILVSSSVQAELDNPYGRSKKAGGDLLIRYAEENNIDLFLYRLPNVFGKWSRPNYNSAVATFCHNIARGLPIQVNDPNTVLRLVYIDDVLCEFINALEGKVIKEDGYCIIPTVHTVTLQTIVDLLHSFKESRSTLSVPNMRNAFEKALYSTYLSFLPEDGFSYMLKMNSDPRGSFTEIIRTAERGQFSVNISNPSITKGNHWHHTKNEKFVVVQGEGVIRFRKIGTEEVIEYKVSGSSIEVVDIPPGYTHNITNVGEGELVTFMWANEPFDPNNPDTIYEEV